jgi:hypothetical protein
VIIVSKVKKNYMRQHPVMSRRKYIRSAMAGAKRHYLPGRVWFPIIGFPKASQLKEALRKLAVDRQRGLVYESRPYKICISKQL